MMLRKRDINSFRTIIILFILVFYAASVKAEFITIEPSSYNVGYASDMGEGWINTTFAVGYNDIPGTNNRSYRGFVWFDIPSDVRNGNITSVKISYGSMSPPVWNDLLNNVYIYGMGSMRWSEFSSSSKGQWYGLLQGGSYHGTISKSSYGRSVTIANPRNIEGKYEYGFSFRAYPEIPSGSWGDQSHYIQIYRPRLNITYEPKLTSVSLGGSTQVNENSTSQYACTAGYSDGSTTSCTSSASWSENSSYASINGSGLLTTGTVTSDKPFTITVTYGGVSVTHSVTIENATITSITISGSAQVNENSTSQYSCTANYSDGRTGNCTNAASWSDNTSYAYMNNSSGLLRTYSVTSDQPITITATYGGKSDTHNVTIKNVPPTLSSITISGLTQVNENSTSQYTCTATYSDSSTSSCTSSASWSDNTSYAYMNNSSGLLRTYSVTSDQPITITATYGGKSDTHNVNIIAATLSSITISGSTQVNENSTSQYTCTATYSDSSTDGLCTYIGSWGVISSYASINDEGILTTDAVSSDQPVEITLTYGGKSDTHSVTIKNIAATLSSITISGSTEVDENSTAQYSCTATYSNSSTSSCTSAASWGETCDSATINSSGFLVTSSVAADQSCQITASYSGKLDTHSITIKDTSAPDITVTPTTIAFENVNINSDSDKTVTVTNDGNTSLDIETVTDPSVPFSKVSDNCTGQPLAPSASCTMTIRFSPTTLDDFNSTFNIPSDDPDENPVTVALTGSGGWFGTPDIDVSKNSLSFLNIVPGVNAEQTLTVTNLGDGYLNITTISSPSAPFSIVSGQDGCSGTTVTPNESCTVKIRFNSGPFGAFDSSLSIASNDPDESTVDVGLLGSSTAVDNDHPTDPSPVSPVNGATNMPTTVTFKWAKSSDSDGVSYNLYCDTSPSFTGATPIQVASVENNGIMYAGIGNGIGLMLFGIITAGSIRGRKRIWLWVCMFIVTIAFLISCGSSAGGGGSSGGGGGSSPAPAVSNDVTQSVSGLSSGTTYYWKVVADDGNGGLTESDTQSFTTQ